MAQKSRLVLQATDIIDVRITCTHEGCEQGFLFSAEQIRKQRIPSMCPACHETWAQRKIPIGPDSWRMENILAVKAVNALSHLMTGMEHSPVRVAFEIRHPKA